MWPCSPGHHTTVCLCVCLLSPLLTSSSPLSSSTSSSSPPINYHLSSIIHHKADPGGHSSLHLHLHHLLFEKQDPIPVVMSSAVASQAGQVLREIFKIPSRAREQVGQSWRTRFWQTGKSLSLSPSMSQQSHPSAPSTPSSAAAG